MSRTHLAILRRRRQVEIDEAGAGDLGLADQRRVRQLREQQLRQLARIALHRSRQLHRQIAGKITMRGLLRPLDVDRRVGLGGRDTQQRGAHQVGEVGLQVVTHQACFGRELLDDAGQAADYTMCNADGPGERRQR
jgi:hypothetical protein